MQDVRYVLLLIVAGIGMPIVLAACGGSEERVENSDAARADSPYLNVSAEAHYVGIAACKTCHVDKFETYQHTGMGRSFKSASLSLSVADWERPAPIYDPDHDLYYQPFHRGEELFVREYRLDGRDTVHQRVERIDYIVGSGQHTNSHIMAVNGYLYQMPLTWYAQDGRWDLPPGFQAGANRRFSREIALECMSCHNARPLYVEGSGNRYEHVPQGIDCEQCHGPGSIHIERMTAGQGVDVSTEVDYSIVNPGKLSIDRQFDVCRRCHMQGMTVLEEDRTFLDFRPSTPLVETMNVYWPRFTDSLSSFIMASHPDRLMMSPCFTGSHAQDSPHTPMTCTTCHDPHVSVRETGAAVFNRSCATCHTPAWENLCTEAPAVRAAVGDNCVACHMPRSGSIDIPHVAITDHNIRVHDRLTTVQADERAEFARLASLIDPDPTPRKLAEGYLTYYEQFEQRPDLLDSAAVFLERAAVEESPERLLKARVRLRFLQGDHRAVTALAPSGDAAGERDPWTLYRIGDSYVRTGDLELAVAWLERAVRAAPENLEFRSRLGNAYVQVGNVRAGLSAFDQVLVANPKFETAWNNRGFAHLLLGDFASAERDFLSALTLNPDAEEAMANLASLYFNTGRPDEARPLATRLLDLEPDNTQYRRLWEALR